MFRQKPEPRRVIRVALCTVMFSLLAFLVWFHFFSSEFLVKVTGHSMEPTLKYGRYYMAHRAASVQKGDIIVFPKPDGTYIKRVYAVPGDQLYLVSEYLDDGSLMWMVVRGGDKGDPGHLGSVVDKVFTVPEGFVWVEGDNITSEGSGTFGMVPVQTILGVVDEP